MKLFRSKKQAEALKELPLPTNEKVVTTKLKLKSLKIIYNIDNRKPFSLNLVYCERPTDWGNQGTSNDETIYTDSWPELIDKALEYFGVDAEVTATVSAD